MAEDLTNLEGLIDELEARRGKARGMGGPEKLERRRKAGMMNARERVDYLVDKGSFIETGLLGVSGLTLIGHGRSTPRAIRNGIDMAARLVEARVQERLADLLRPSSRT